MQKTDKKEKPPSRVDLVEKVYGLLCSGARRADIIATATAEKWPRKGNAIDDLIADATKQLADEASIDIFAETGKSIARLNKLFQDSMAVQDHKTALAVQRELNRMLLLRAKVKAIKDNKPAAQPTTAAAPARLRIVN